MLKTAGTIFAVIAVGTVAIAWSKLPISQPTYHVQTIDPDSFGRSGLAEQKVDDMSFVDIK
jgi:hypothetical protein